MRHIINQFCPAALRAIFTHAEASKKSSRRLSVWSVGFVILFAAAGSPGMANEPPVALEPAPRYTFREDHDPNGTGKFYMGREIALVMSFHGAPWLERPEREEEERLSKLVQLLDLKPNQVAADIGAGSGVITMMMADQVGPKGKVLAVDIQQEMLDLLADKLNRRNLLNVDLVLGTEKSPKIAPGTLDLALMVDVYHELEFPYEMMKEMAASLKPGGRLVFVEYRREDPEVPIKLIHKMSEAQVRKEAEQPEFGLKWKATHKDLPRQHVIVFEKSAQK
ncbi:Methyltransferase type 11 [Planctopirus limnophila DSM 3776]|uniref:Methyltransferase type 11 n=1 Tax=Planctopirus limnophila (strain ATCC 43296 / DSM 3776 / IFAM 1008 / Mu 290) TaxID=521674 RepID=D5SZ95_PLAL2|nr:class I SAM-dependent methyltransferase [Planctopirus limnophila]ADG69996.1 Methyltransferase type 11 [Planctopirus limnophila DSM 3776]